VAAATANTVTHFLPAPGSQFLSRAQEREILAALRPGRRVEALWRYGATMDTLESDSLWWKGVVVSTGHLDGDGSTHYAVVEYEPCTGLEEGGKFRFPPPPDGAALCELLEVKLPKAAKVMPRFTTFGSAIPTAQAASEPALKKARTETDSQARALVAIVEHMAGDDFFEASDLVPGLRVPVAVDDDMRAFYPNRWIGRGDEWETAATKVIRTRWQVKFTNEGFNEELNSHMDAMRAMLSSTNEVPKTKAAFFPYFWTMALILRLVSMARAKDKAWDCGEKFKNSFLDLWRKENTKMRWKMAS